MISVIVPVYKAELYLHRCIDSILAQSYTDFELLLVDDGSPDNCGAICDKYAKKDSRVNVYHKPNGGVSSARNLGLDNARGEYVTFCDADDYVDTEWLAVYSDAIAMGVDFAIQGFHIIDKGKIIKKTLSKELGDTVDAKRKLIVALMSQGVYGYLWAKLFRREIIEENHIRFDTYSAYREDEQFLSKYLEYATTFKCIDKENYYYNYPIEGKCYGGDSCYTLLQIYKSLDIIFDRCIPADIYKLDYVYVKNGAARYIAAGRTLGSYHIDLYQRMVLTLNYTHGLKNRLRNHLIVNNNKYGVLSRWVVRLLHCANLSR